MLGFGQALGSQAYQPGRPVPAVWTLNKGPPKKVPARVQNKPRVGITGSTLLEEVEFRVRGRFLF